MLNPKEYSLNYKKAMKSRTPLPLDQTKKQQQNMFVQSSSTISGSLAGLSVYSLPKDMVLSAQIAVRICFFTWQNWIQEREFRVFAMVIAFLS